MDASELNMSYFREFLAVVQYKSISAAAASCYISQPALSKHIKSLEEYFGRELFHRAPKEIVLTRDGEKLFPYIQTIWKKFTSMETLFGTPQDTDRNLNILLPPCMYVYDIFSDLADFSSRNKNLQIDYCEVNWYDTLDTLRGGDFQLAYVRDCAVEPELYDLIDIYIDRLIACVNEKHILARQSSLALEDLAQERIFILNKNHSLHYLMNHALNMKNMQIDERNCLGTENYILEFVRQKRGVGIITKRQFEACNHEGTVAIEITPAIPTKVCLAKLHGSQLNHASWLFWNYIADRYAKNMTLL